MIFSSSSRGLLARLSIGACGLFALVASNNVMAQVQVTIVQIQAGDTNGLYDAIQQGNNFNGLTQIRISADVNGSYNFPLIEAFGSTDNALPQIRSRIRLDSFPLGGQKIRFQGGDAGHRFAEVVGGGKLELYDVVVENFTIQGNGAGAFLHGDGILATHRGEFWNNSAAEGGGVFAQDQSHVKLDWAVFGGNHADSLGGAISLTGQSSGVAYQTWFTNNIANVFGCDVNVASNAPPPIAYEFSSIGSLFDGDDCATVRYELPFGRMRIQYNAFIDDDNDAVDATGTFEYQGSIFFRGSFRKGAVAKATCNDFGSGAFNSAGYNIASDDCFLDQPTDLPSTNPLFAAPDANGILALQAGSPAIDGGQAGLVTVPTGDEIIPCGNVDIRGLGRPQDGNGDGIFECDIGVYEVQGGPDIGAAQSGAFFDPDRGGEGVFLEMLPNGQALVAVFTYTLDGSGLAWFIGVGDVVGNSVVVNNILIAEGGVFGAGFDPANIVRTPVGDLSLIFPSCESVTAPGRLVFDMPTGGTGFEDLLTVSSRLSSIVACDNSTPVATSGRSGSFFDPARDGEGIFVQWLPDGRVVVIWYTFTPDGRQFWTISGDVTVDGNTVTANMLYPETGTQFGSGFNPSQVDLQPWGTLTLDYQPGCNTINFAYNSTVPGFGAGNYTYSRLTDLAGTSCDL